MNAFNQPVKQLSVKEFAERLLPNISNTALQLIDVREPEEIEISSLEGFVNLPLSQFPQWSENIGSLFNPHVETVVMCHHGIRSAQMCAWLVAQGFTNVKNLSGGIDAYAEAIDLRVPRY